MQKYQGRGKAAKIYDQPVHNKNIIMTDKGSQERPPQSLATDRSDHMHTNRRKKTERTLGGDKSETKQMDSFMLKSKREPTSGTAKKIK